MADSEEKFRAAFKELLATLPYDSISIQSICTKAGLSRKTFSKRFSGKEDLVRSQMYEDFTKPVLTLRSILDVDQMEGSTQLLLEKSYTTFYENRAYYQAVVKGLGVMWFVSAYAENSLELNRHVYTQLGLEGKELDYVSNLFAGAGSMVLKWWMDEGFETSPAELARMDAKWQFAHWLEKLAETPRE